MIRTFKVRLFPTKEQEQKFYQHIGCCRFVWNYMIELQQKRKENKEKHLSGFDMTKFLTSLKKEEEYKWLKEVSSKSLHITCIDLSKAYKSFFDKIRGYPKFKSRKRSNKSFPINTQAFYFATEDLLNIEKVGKVKYKTNRTFPIGRGNIKVSNTRVKLIGKKWILTFGIECENQALALNGKIGIDLGIKELAYCSHNGKPLIFHNINKSQRVRKLKSKLKHLQRNVSRKYDTNNRLKVYEDKWHKSNKIIRLEEQIAEIYRKLTNIRNNYLHQTTHYLVSLNPEQITIEDLNVSGMMKNRHLSKAIAEQCLYEFRRQIEYKAKERGIKVVAVPRFYPSSKTCSCCGNYKKDLKLSDRVYKCEHCGFVIDRDYNAALNLERYVG
jgi:putative transposase